MCSAFCNRTCKNGIPNLETWKNISFVKTEEDGPHILHMNENHLKNLLETETKQLCEATAE